MTIVLDEQSPREAREIIKLINEGADSYLLLETACMCHCIHRRNERLSENPSLSVQSGLFAGLILSHQKIGSELMPKIVGTYELEVQKELAHCIGQVDSFLDIGCAEGFYVAGVSRLMEIPSVGIDINPASQQAIQFLAEANALQGKIRFCDHLQDSHSHLRGKLLCLIDVDGNEVEALENLNQFLKTSASISSCKLILETSGPFYGTQNTSELIHWLEEHHWTIIKVIDQNYASRFQRIPNDASLLEWASNVAEHRPGQQKWIVASRQEDNAKQPSPTMKF